jgi:hypothetical protein
MVGGLLLAILDSFVRGVDLIIFITAGATLRLDAPADGLPWLRLLTFVSSPGALVGGRLLFLDAVDVVDEGDDDDCANHHDNRVEVGVRLFRLGIGGSLL